MNYAVDLGNTQIKCGSFEGDDLIELYNWDNKEEAITHLRQINKGSFIVSSVSGNPEWVTTILGQGEREVLLLDSKTQLPILNNYDSPDTLGMDRIAAVCGAQKLVITVWF